MAESTNRGYSNAVASFTIGGTNQVIRAGDCVLIRPSLHGTDGLPSVALVEKMEKCAFRGVAAQVRWYYHPEETSLGRRCFHGEKELLVSDHFSTRSAHTFVGKCVVHTMKKYRKLCSAQPEDFFCRLAYKVASGSVTPERVAVYCTCEMPYNPDLLMLRCSDCKDRFHPSCLRMDIEQAIKLDHFVCPNCCVHQENFSMEHSNEYASLTNAKRKKINITGASVLLGVPRDSAPIQDGYENDVAKKGEETNVDATPPRKLSRLHMISSSNKKSDTSVGAGAKEGSDENFMSTKMFNTKELPAIFCSFEPKEGGLDSRGMYDDKTEIYVMISLSFLTLGCILLFVHDFNIPVEPPN